MLPLAVLLFATVAMESDPQLSPEPQVPEAVEASPEQQDDTLQWETRSLRAKDFRTQMMTGRKAQDASYDAESALRSKRAGARNSCRDRLRKANRNERLGVLLLCVKQDFGATLETIRKRQDGLGSRAGTSADTTSLIRGRGDLLIDALSTIIQAIDAGVYSNEDELIEAKNNLRDKYMLPYQTLLPRSDTEHALAGIAHMLLRSRDIDRSQLPEEVRTALEQSDACLTTVEKTIESLTVEEAINASHRLAIRNCLGKYREAQALLVKLSAPSSEEPAPVEWQKRSRGRLPKTRN